MHMRYSKIVIQSYPKAEFDKTGVFFKIGVFIPLSDCDQDLELNAYVRRGDDSSSRVFSIPSLEVDSIRMLPYPEDVKDWMLQASRVALETAKKKTGLKFNRLYIVSPTGSVEEQKLQRHATV